MRPDERTTPSQARNARRDAERAIALSRGSEIADIETRRRMDARARALFFQLIAEGRELAKAPDDAEYVPAAGKTARERRLKSRTTRRGR